MVTATKVLRNEFFGQTELPSTTVSYTHLRAHETDSYLVCRLLLEKKNKRNTEKKTNTHIYK